MRRFYGMQPRGRSEGGDGVQGLGLEGRAQFFVNLSRESRVSKILCRRSAGSSDCGPRPSHRTPAYASLSAILSPVLLASERTSWCSILLCEWRVSHDWGFRLATPFFGQFLGDFFCSPDRVLIVFEVTLLVPGCVSYIIVDKSE